MSWGSDWGPRWRAVLLIQRRDLEAMIFGWGLYLALALAFLASLLILRNDLAFVNESGLSVFANPFALPFFITALISSFFLAISSVTTIAREKGQGTLEVLFYGPVDHVSYIVGKYLAQVITYLVMMALYVPSFILHTLLTNLVFPAGLAWAILLSVFTVSAVVALGIFLSTVARNVRASLFLFGVTTLAFLGIQVGHTILVTLPAQGRYYDPMLFLKNTFAILNQTALWLSPYSYLDRGMEAVVRGSAGVYLALFLLSAVYTVGFLGLSAISLRHRGVRRK